MSSYAVAATITVTAIAVLAVGFIIGVTWTVADETSHRHHRATVEYRGTPCEEDEVLWWVEDGVRACTPIDDIKGR